MKFSSKHRFIAKIAAIVLLSVGGAWLMLMSLYFSAALVLLLIVVLGWLLYSDRKKLIGKMERMISGIRHSDFSYHFTTAPSADELDRLYREMNEALGIFRNRAQDSMRDEAETQAWQKLISVLTHEIMNSMTPIISLSETLSGQPVQDLDVMKEAMEAIHRRGKGLLVFVENYRKLTRIPEPMLHPVRVEPMLQSLQQLVAADSIAFTYSVYPEELILHADRSMVEQTLINLVKNAHEACLGRSEPKIGVKAAKTGNEIRISVSDNGTGISPEAMEKIFIPFYTTKPNGSGIGLSLCRQMMLRHKGRIDVKTDNRGSVFTLHFPNPS